MENNTKKPYIERKNGATLLHIGDEALWYAAFRSFRPSEENLPDFYGKGFRLFCIHSSGIMTALAQRTIPYSEFGEVWSGDGEYNWDNLKAQTDMFEKLAPDGYYAAMIDLNTPAWMLENNPGMRDTWTELIQEVTNPTWREGAKKYIKAYMEKINELLPGKVFAVYLLAGGTTEWYTRLFEAAIDSPSENHKNSYGKEIPGTKAFFGSDDGILRNFKKDPEALEYMKYYNEVVPEAIADFAKCVKEASNGRLLTGVFYGYVASERDGTVRAGYNEAERIYRFPDIDIIISPASYDLRKLKSTSAMRAPVDSITLNNKLYVHEIDAATHLTHNNKFAALHGVPDDHMENLAQTTAYLRREIGMVLAKGQGFWLFDMFGGWYKDEDTMNEIEKIRKLADSLKYKDMKNISEVAFFIDLNTNYYVTGDSDYPMFQFQIEELNLMGMPWDCYTTGDLFNENFDEDRYKLFIFPNLFKVDEKLIKRINALREKGKSMIFMHAAGYITDNGFDDSKMEEITGIKLKRCAFDSAKMKLDIPGVRETELNFSERINAWRERQPGKERVKFNMPPVFEADGRYEVLGRLKENGSAGFVINERAGGFDAYCACAPIPADIIAYLAKRAGASDITAPGTVVYANSAIMTVYSYEGGKIKINSGGRKMKEYFSGEEYESGDFVDFSPIETKIFLLE